jgi:hypothetical protein
MECRIEAGMGKNFDGSQAKVKKAGKLHHSLNIKI